jgi:N-acylneuraminate cytidylyltransferase
MGLERLRKLTDVEVFILSKESNPVVQKRSKKLNIPVIHDCDDKINTLKKMAEPEAYMPNEVAYVGNDLNDLECMNWVGHGIAVQNAEEQVKKAASKVIQEKGGEGAVRRLCEVIIDAKNT